MGADMVAWLLDHGATDLQIGNFNNETPLQVAEARSYTAIADLLRSRGAR